MIKLDSKIPDGHISDKWINHKFNIKLVNPANKRKYDIIVVGTGLAGASAAATMGELGYNVKVFTYHDSARRAHSIAAQGGINAAKKEASPARIKALRAPPILKPIFTKVIPRTKRNRLFKIDAVPRLLNF